MKKCYLTLLSAVLFFGGCSRYLQDLSVSVCQDDSFMNDSFSVSAEIMNAMEELVDAGVPGISIAVYSTSQGWWASAAGLAKIEDQTPMQTCHLQYLQSVSKTYMAVAILQLSERGTLDLDKSIDHYLSEEVHKAITDSEKITVRMLLNHTSGIRDYNFDPQLVSVLLQDPEYPFVAMDYVNNVKNKPLLFNPGSQFRYTNMNYVLLSLIADHLTGDHAKFIEENIFKTLDLKNTYYRSDDQYLNYETLVNCYWDRYSDGIVENVSQMQRSNVRTLVGDDGIVATPVDVVIFMRGLIEGKLLSQETLTEMQTWVNNAENQPQYGLGLAYSPINGDISIGHSGGGIGAGCELRYFSDKGIYAFLAINLGTVTGSPLHEGVEKARDKLYAILLE